MWKISGNFSITSMSLKKKCVSAKLNIISSILNPTWARRFASLRYLVAYCPVSKEWNTTMVSSRSQMNIRSGPASVVSAEPILFPLPLCLLPRLHGFVVATVKVDRFISQNSSLLLLYIYIYILSLKYSFKNYMLCKII